MNKLTYVTGNYGKYIGVKEKFENYDIEIDYFTCDLDEPNINDIEYISKEKAKQAYELLNSPVFVSDCGFYIEGYPNNPGYPGALVKRSGISSDIDNLLLTMKNITNRNCYFLDCITFYDGINYYQFIGKSTGQIAYEKKGNNLKKAKSNLWYVFIPTNHTKTLAQMTDDERKNRDDNRVSATMEFIDWYVNVYSKEKILLKKKK